VTRIERKNSIERQLKTLLEDVKKDVVFNFEDILNCLNCVEFKDSNVFGVWMHNERVNPSLSFHFNKGKIITFDKEREANDALKVFEIANNTQPGAVSKIEKSNYYLVFSTNLTETNAEKLLTSCSLIARRSINLQNVYVRALRRVEGNFSAFFSQNNNLSDFNSTCIKETILQHTKTPCVSFKIEQEWLHNSASSKIDHGTSFFSRASILSDESSASALKKLDITEDQILDCLNTNTSDVHRGLKDEVIVSFKNFTQGVYLCCYVFKPARPVGDEGEIIVAISSNQFSTPFIKFFHDAILHFEQKSKQSRKLAILNKLHDITHRKNTRKQPSSYSDIEDEFKSLVKLHAKLLFSVTRAHSFSVRIFEPSSRSLKLLDSGKTSTGVYSDKVERIPIKDFKGSVNAFTFFAGEALPYVYLPNVHGTIPAQYKELGLEGSIKSRVGTKSEICFPLLQGGVSVGVINFEANELDAFEGDIAFLLTIKNLLEDHYNKFYEYHDQQWFKKNASFTDDLHELDNYLRVEGFFSSKQASVLNRIFFHKETDDLTEKSGTLDFFEEWYLNWSRTYYEQYYDEANIKSIQRLVRFYGKSDFQIPRRVLQSLKIIIKQFVNNIDKYAYIDSDFIVVDCTLPNLKNSKDGSSHNLGSKIRLRVVTYGLISPDILERICLRPINKYSHLKQSDEPHYGMYLVGLLVRSLGGAVVVSGPDNQQPNQVEKQGSTIFDIIVPIVEERKRDATA